MKRVLAIVALLAVVFTAWSFAPRSIPAASPRAERVTVVLAPYLTWRDVTPTATPELWRLAETGAAGVVNSRSRAREAGEPASVVEGALTLSAGAWTAPDFSAPAAYTATETYETSTAAVAFRRLTGSSARGAGVLYLGGAQVQRGNDQKALDVVVGALGDAVHAAGGHTAAVGNSDSGYPTSLLKRSRPAAATAADTQGRVDAGDVSASLLREDPGAPYGVSTDPEAFARAYDAALAKLGDGPQLVVLDPGDLSRARRFAAAASDAVVERQHLTALRELDGVVALARERAGRDGVVIVVSEALYFDRSGAPEGLGAIVVNGPGFDGLLTSPSTHRTGLVTNLDVTATVLEALHIERPVSVLGDAMFSRRSGLTISDRVALLTRMNDGAIAVDSAKAGIMTTFIWLVVVTIALGALLVARGSLWTPGIVRRVGALVRSLALLVLAMPLAGWLMFLVIRYPATPALAEATFVGATIVVFALATFSARRFGHPAVLSALSLATVLLLIADQVVGAPLSYTNVFGYSPLAAARFYGLGNESAALLMGALLVGLALLAEALDPAPAASLVRRFGIPALGLLSVGVAAAPFLGANIGVAVWGVVGTGLAWALATGRRIGWRMVVALLVAAALLVAVLAVADLVGSGEQTHVGRAVTSAEKGGSSQLTDIVVRKAQTNARVFSKTDWSLILLAVLAFLGLMRVLPSRPLARLFAERPTFRAALLASLAMGVVAFFTEDSGIVIPALIVVYTGAAVVSLLAGAVLAEAGERA